MKLIHRGSLQRLSEGSCLAGPWCAAGAWQVARLHRPERNQGTVACVDSPDRHVAFPGICKTRSGDLLVVYRNGTDHVDNTARIMTVRSTDLGRTWRKPQVVFDDGVFDDRNSGISCLSDGTLVVPFNIYNRGEDRFAYFLTSQDDGHTWGGLTRIGDNPHYRCRSGVVERQPNEWLFPVYDCSGPAEGRGSFVEAIDRSTGKSTRSTICAPPDAVGDETTLVQASNGDLIALMRVCDDATRHALQSVSKDGGRTWSAAIETDIPTQHAPMDLLRLDDGRLVAGFSFHNRRNERLVISPDHGQTWDVENSLDVRDGDPAYGMDRSYIASVQLDEATIGSVVYETLPYPQGGKILFCRTSISDFGREPVYALHNDAGGGSAVYPADWSEYEARVSYRFTGRFTQPGAAFAVLANVQGSGEAIACKLTMASRAHLAESNRIIVEHVGLGSGPERLLDVEANGDWFDDGCEHELSVRNRRGTIHLAIDGMGQLEFRAPWRWGGIGFGVENASAAVYEVEVTRPAKG